MYFLEITYYNIKVEILVEDRTYNPFRDCLSSTKIYVSEGQSVKKLTQSATYTRTKKGLITRIYGNQRTRAKKRGDELPTYTVKELQIAVLAMPLYDELHKNWVNSDYDRWLTPSLDRIDDYKSYTEDNIELKTWQENHDKALNDRKIGKNNKTRNAVYHKNKKEISVECEFCGKHYVMGSANHTILTLHNSPIRCIQCANGKWSLSKLRTEALKYKTQKDFYTLGRRAYSVAHRKGLLGIIGDHLTSTIKENIFKKLVDTPGIYYLMQKEEIVYIGKSVQCMSRRLCYHLEDSFKHFDRVKAYIIKNDADIARNNLAELKIDLEEEDDMDFTSPANDEISGD